MNTYTWYYIFNRADFAALDLVSRNYSVNLEGIGQKDILVTQGNLLGMTTWDGVFLALEMSDENPFEFDSRAIYIDANNNIWLGILIES